MRSTTGASVTGRRRPATKGHWKTALGQTGSGHRGNKSYLPTKACERCQRPMTWRKAWAKNWDAVKYCSEACRRRSS